jgi:hypothetical protein
VLKDPYSIGYGANGTLPFRIFGTSADDENAKAPVLSTPLMESLPNYSALRYNRPKFLDEVLACSQWGVDALATSHIWGAKHNIIALEASDGEVFGSFTSELLWRRKNWNDFGIGESFLWRTRQQPRKTGCLTVEDQAHLESELARCAPALNR